MAETNSSFEFPGRHRPHTTFVCISHLTVGGGWSVWHGVLVVVTISKYKLCQNSCLIGSLASKISELIWFSCINLHKFLLFQLAFLKNYSFQFWYLIWVYAVLAFSVSIYIFFLPFVEPMIHSKWRHRAVKQTWIL